MRAVVKGKTTVWSAPFGFNMRWEDVAQKQTSPTGLIRWSTVDGATGYEVWYTDIAHHFTTNTNVADEREYWTFHPDKAQTVHWRVRAVRHIDSPALPNSLSRVSYGPYSPTYTTFNPRSLTTGALAGLDALSDVDSTATVPRPHQLTPGFAWSGADGIYGDRTELRRAYVSTDAQCVNTVLTGSIVGGPAWAPRTTQPLALPGTSGDLSLARGDFLKYGAQAKAFMADVSPVTASEAGGTATDTVGSSSSPGTQVSTVTSGQVDLWDIGWPTGRYWWTVVPVAPITVTVPAGRGGRGARYQQGARVLRHRAPGRCLRGRSRLELRQGECSGHDGVLVAVRVRPRDGYARCGRRDSAPAIPPASACRLEARARCDEVPGRDLARPVPWVAAHKQETYATSIVLDLTKKDLGTWFYCVRGVNPGLPKNADDDVVGSGRAAHHRRPVRRRQQVASSAGWPATSTQTFASHTSWPTSPTR